MQTYTQSVTHYRSSDGIHAIRACFFVPKKAPRAIVQIVHGMTEHIGRYHRLAEVLTDAGFVVCGNDHLGHGGSVRNADEYGFFAKKNGVEHVLRDVRKMTLLARKRYPNLPFFLLGHSMGSMFARLYAVRCACDIDALICLGTTGTQKLLPLGEGLSALIDVTKGSHYRSAFLTKTAFRGYCSRCAPEEGPKAWVSRDRSVVQEGYGDISRNFIFTASAYRDLFKLIRLINADAWYRAFPVNLPTLLASGTEDPVGGYGEGVREVADKLLRRGVKDLSFYLYPDVRHELHNDPDAPIFFDDLLEWMEVVLRS